MRPLLQHKARLLISKLKWLYYTHVTEPRLDRLYAKMCIRRQWIIDVKAAGGNPTEEDKESLLRILRKMQKINNAPANTPFPRYTFTN